MSLKNKSSKVLHFSTVLLIAFLLTLLPQYKSSKIEELKTSILIPTLMDVCEKRDLIIIAGDKKLQLIHYKQDKYSQESFSLQSSITQIKCLSHGHIAINTINGFFIYDPTRHFTKVTTLLGELVSISQESETKKIFLLQKNGLSLSEIQIYNYTTLLPKQQLINFVSNIVKASYIFGHRFIYVTDELSNLEIYQYPFKQKSKIIDTQELFPIAQISTLKNINSAFLSDNNGNFALIHKNQLIDQWNDTPYKKGVLCTKQIFILVNKKRIALYDQTQVTFYDQFKLSGQLEQIVCTHQNGLKAYLLDNSGKVIIVSLQQDEGVGVYIFISVIILLVIIAAIIKVVYFPKKQPPQLITTDDAAARQDKQYAYQQMNLINDPRDNK